MVPRWSTCRSGNGACRWKQSLTPQLSRLAPWGAGLVCGGWRGRRLLILDFEVAMEEGGRGKINRIREMLSEGTLVHRHTTDKILICLRTISI